MAYRRGCANANADALSRLPLPAGRAVVPAQGYSQVLRDLHSSHPGIVKMKAIARIYMWWPNIDHNIDYVMGTCLSYQAQRDRVPGASLQILVTHSRRLCRTFFRSHVSCDN